MELFYFKDPNGNFGDDLNEWVWDLLIPGWRRWQTDGTIIGIGTLLNAELDIPEGRRIVLGSGYGYGIAPRMDAAAGWDVRAVRGPRTAEVLGLPGELAAIDPAALLPLVYGAPSCLPKSKVPVFVPHCSNSDRHNWSSLCRNIGIEFVSPRRESHDVVSSIASAPLVLAESLHAAIIADAYRVPWICVSVNDILNTPKWLDWTESLDLDLRVVRLLPELSALGTLRRRLTTRKLITEGNATTSRTAPYGKRRDKIRRNLEYILIERRLRAAAKTRPNLSNSDILAQRQARLREVLDVLVDEFSNRGISE